MNDREDMDLVRHYARDRSEAAFRVLVDRHIHMVLAVALRETGQQQLAEDVTQAVFIVLAQKAASLPSGTLLAGWLFRATRFAAANARRAEARREHWELKAAQMEPTPSSESSGDADPIAPLLHEALAELAERDRVAILLRFFENKSMEEIGRALGTSADAAKMRLSRAMERLRDIFKSRGVTVSSAALLAALSAQVVQAAPSGLASAVAAAAVLNQTSASVSPLVHATLLVMAQSKSKTLLVAALVLLLIGTTAVVVFQQSLGRRPNTPGGPAASTTTPATAQPKVLVFRDAPSWDRNPDFEDAMASMRVEHVVKPSTEMSRTDLAAYRVIIIPGAQWNTEFYDNYAANAARFDQYVTNGGTLLLELNGAENASITLPRNVTMVRHGSLENTILVPRHPVLSPLSGKNIRANAASHGWLAGVPKDALVLVAETVDGKADVTKPTFVEYPSGAGRVIAACQCFHDRDGSGRGILMETSLDYATERKWFADARPTKPAPAP